MRFEMTWRNKWLTSQAKSIGEMADALQAAADELRAMEAKGVVLAEGSDVEDDYATLVTEDPDVAGEFDFEAEDSSAEEAGESGDAEDRDPDQILVLDAGQVSHVPQAKFLDDLEFYLEIVGRMASVPGSDECDCCGAPSGYHLEPLGQLMDLVPGTIKDFRDQIVAKGWSTTALYAYDVTYSTGMFETFGHPEVVAVGWYKTRPVEDMENLIDRIGESVKAGKKYEPGRSTKTFSLARSASSFPWTGGSIRSASGRRASTTVASSSQLFNASGRTQPGGSVGRRMR
jgi:hypothetical protein